MVEVAEKQDPNIDKWYCKHCRWKGCDRDLIDGCHCPICWSNDDLIPLNIP